MSLRVPVLQKATEQVNQMNTYLIPGSFSKLALPFELKDNYCCFRPTEEY